MKKKVLTIKIKILTGLHIGVGSDKLQIGGIDNPFIKDPVSNRPYIPGSSLKGKLRCLLETEGDYENGTKNDQINLVFGATSEYLQGKGSEFKESPTRIIFRDLMLTDDYMKKYDNGMLQTEIKTEIKIDRTKGTAADGALRTTERIPPDTEFAGEVLIRYRDEEEYERVREMLDNGIRLINQDYLGGSGSRGYGSILATLS